MWRAEEEALWQRLEDAKLLRQLWHRESVGAPPLHPRAAGLIHALRTTSTGRAVVEGRNVEQLSAALRPDSLRDLPPVLLHHLAVYEARLARALGAGGHAQAALEASLRELAAWLALAEEESYLAALGEAQMSDGGAATALDAWQRTLRGLGAAARSDATGLGPTGKLALEALARVSDACGRADVGSVRRGEVDRMAERLRAQAIEDALAGVAHAADDALARDLVDREGPKLVDRMVSVWHWSGRDEEVERFAVDTITPVAWRAYKNETGWTSLERIVQPLRPLVESLRRRVQGDPRRIAYAAPVAQMYVFYTEVAPFEAKAEPARLGLEVCPTHRNARVIMASYQVGIIRRRLQRPFLTQQDRQDLRDKLAYVRELHPHYDGLEAIEHQIG